MAREINLYLTQGHGSFVVKEPGINPIIDSGILTLKRDFFRETGFDVKEIAKVTKQDLPLTKVKKANITLSEDMSTLRVLHFKKDELDKKRVQKYLEGSIGTTIPSPFEEVSFEYNIINETELSYDVLLVLINKRALNNFYDLFGKLKVKIGKITTIEMAIYNLLTTKSSTKDVVQLKGNTMVVVVIKNGIFIVIFENNIPVFTFIEDLEREKFEMTKEAATYIYRLQNYYSTSLKKGSDKIRKIVVMEATKNEHGLLWHKDIKELFPDVIVNDFRIKDVSYLFAPILKKKDCLLSLAANL